jgi:hypothetical protein
MARVRPNRSLAELVPRGSPRPGPAEGWATVTVLVTAVRPMPDDPDAVDLLSGWRGHEMTALLPPDVAAAAQDGSAWWAEASLAGPATLRVYRRVTD